MLGISVVPRTIYYLRLASKKPTSGRKLYDPLWRKIITKVPSNSRVSDGTLPVFRRIGRIKIDPEGKIIGPGKSRGENARYLIPLRNILFDVLQT